MEANPPSGVNDSRSVSRDEPKFILRFCPRIARSRIVSQEVGATPREVVHLRLRIRLVKGRTAKAVKSFFLSLVITEATFLPDCADTLAIVNGEVTIRG